VIIGTAGHVDHGKSALVEALTGRAMDPLAEERRRGITLDLHFAALMVGDNGTHGVVDVPGHEDLVRTMVAGASGIDLVLLVVAADEGIMPQTREHLAVVEQLRIPGGIPVITKTDLVTPARLELTVAEVSALVRGSPVDFTPPVATSARTGQGLDALRGLIAGRAAEPPSRRAADLARLPIDRAFTLPGTGPIVTGTTWSGCFRIGDAVVVLPPGHRAKVRSLGHHGREVQQTAPGERVALGLAGVEIGRLARGQVLVHEHKGWESSRVMDAQIELLPSARRPLAHLSRVRVHLGTLEVMARVHPRHPIAPGGQGPARLVLEAAMVARGRDRLVLRSYSPVEVIGGGWVVDPAPPPGKPLWSEDLACDDVPSRLSALLERRPHGLAESAAPVILGLPPDELPGASVFPVERVGGVLVSRKRLVQAQEAALAAVQAHQRTSPAEPGMPRETLRQGLTRFGAVAEAAIAGLVERKTLILDGAVIREADFQPSTAGGAAAIERLVQAVARAGLSPATVAELAMEFELDDAANALRIAARHGRIVLVGRDRYYSREALTRFVQVLATVAGKGPITPAALREATGLSRKYLIPLLEWADQAGLTIRRGDARVAGPRLAAGGPA
jgi:selenocysteine-specific elongation factor